MRRRLAPAVVGSRGRWWSRPTVYDRNLRTEGARWIVFSFISGSLDQDVSELWPATTQQALLVWGTAGRFSSFEDAEDFVLARPDARLVLLRDAALLPNEKRSEAFNEVLIGSLHSVDR